VLLDADLPDGDSMDLLRTIGDVRPDLPVIMMAENAGIPAAVRAIRAGAVDFIQKPIEADILRSKANVFFDLHCQRRQIAAQRDALEVASQALREADRRKDEFLAVLGHELRNPVAALNSGVYLLGKSSGTDRAEAIRELMERQLFHLTRLVEDLLDISRISEGKISLQKERIELAVILRSAIEASQPNIEAAGHSFSTDLPDGPLWLEADHTRMAQVVANLLNNAAKYTPPGGAIMLAARRVDDYAEIEVRDNGVGIPSDMQSRIFQIFAQVEGHREQAAGGLGIGLALVRQLVTLHGGSIAVKSEGEGRGSVFTVRVPLGDQAAA
jgi:signal transduction histidine kinase